MKIISIFNLILFLQIKLFAQHPVANFQDKAIEFLFSVNELKASDTIRNSKINLFNIQKAYSLDSTNNISLHSLRSSSIHSKTYLCLNYNDSLLNIYTTTDYLILLHDVLSVFKSQSKVDVRTVSEVLNYVILTTSDNFKSSKRKR